MISAVEGLLLKKETDYVIIDLSGLSFLVFIPSNQIDHIGATGSKVRLHTHLVWKDTGPQLYGFHETKHVDLYEHLISVNGVGPKLALKLMGTLSFNQLSQAIIQDQITLLSKAPGLGKKTAQKICLELKDKVSINLETDKSFDRNHSDALTALTNLGYKPQEAANRIEAVLKKHQKPLDIAEIISFALKIKLG